MDLQGLLFFPVTPFNTDGTVDVDRLISHVEERINDGAACVFAACGTGEFNALRTDEVVEVARAALKASNGRVPVFIGAGGPLASAVELVGLLAELPVSGVLLLPPYLVSAPQDGLVKYVKEIAEASDLPIIVYQRGDMVFEPDRVIEIAALPTVIGLKDGVGDVTKMQIIVSAVRASGNDKFLFFNGLPTAELSMLAYRAVGVSLYSSAVFAFAPDIAMAFYDALHLGDDRRIQVLLTKFFIPFSILRDRQVGYNVALVKAAVSIGSVRAGNVRAPLVEPAQTDISDLNDLLITARAALAEPASTEFTDAKTRV